MADESNLDIENRQQLQRDAEMAGFPGKETGNDGDREQSKIYQTRLGGLNTLRIKKLGKDLYEVNGKEYNGDSLAYNFGLKAASVIIKEARKNVTKTVNMKVEPLFGDETRSDRRNSFGSSYEDYKYDNLIQLPNIDVKTYTSADFRRVMDSNYSNEKSIGIVNKINGKIIYVNRCFLSIMHTAIMVNLLLRHLKTVQIFF